MSESRPILCYNAIRCFDVPDLYLSKKSFLEFVIFIYLFAVWHFMTERISIPYFFAFNIFFFFRVLVLFSLPLSYLRLKNLKHNGFILWLTCIRVLAYIFHK